MEKVLSGEQRWCVVHGDALDVLKTLPDASIDSLVCDPPAGISFMGKEFDSDRGGRDYWIAWLASILREAYRVMKPGAHAFVWALPRTAHWTGMAIENAGFQVRDSVHHVYSVGFPKSLNVSKALDAEAGAERPVIGKRRGKGGENLNTLARPDGGDSEDAKGVGAYGVGAKQVDIDVDVTAPVTPEAVKWAGYGTALKPAHEIWWLARKPFEGTVAQNVREHGTGAINIDGCRVAHASPADLAAHKEQVAAIKERGGSMDGSWKNASDLSGANEVNQAGRWPPNFLISHDPRCKRIGVQSVPANPTWDTPNRQTQPSAFTGSEVSKVRHGREGQASAERRYTESGATDFAALPGARRDAIEEVEQWNCVKGCPVRELGIQSGESCSSGGLSPGGITDADGMLRRQGDRLGAHAGGVGDSGTAARFFPQFQDQLDDIVPFFYEAKPSSRERDAGLGDFTPMSGGQATGRKDESAGTQSPRAGAGRKGGRRNRHPTVKSIDLMRWLVRLVTPKGGVCLDCFAGSGSTGVACMLEGVRFIGIELNDTEAEPFVSTARARIAHAIGIDPHAPRVLSEDPGTGLKQLNLFALGKNES